ncbi:TonB-dependent receptor [Syntrophotalea acetylenica]|uniref:TonB-dependent receptor plug domain-containing protein n=1 Tax=Syntrophotalea acetylenica TaxID=29542 RepID=UPI002A36AAB1|nr:TonB-dependent receptor [Syntrophotalea acetylenica]MDY0261364.1 TonB-dependent receptor [Syntrophotalea acetylenica]
MFIFAGMTKSNCPVIWSLGLVLLFFPIPESVAVEVAASGVFALGEIEVVAHEEQGAASLLTERVSEETLRNFNRDDVAEALDMLPGVHLSKVGGRNESTVYVRGFDLRHVPLYLDGIPIYVPYDGYPDLRRFTTFDLSQIVLSKGFASVLYGPNTMGGAINLVSKRPETAFEGNCGAGYASGDSYQAYFNLGTNQDWWYLQTGASWYNTDYFRLSDDFRKTANEDGGRRENSYARDRKINIKVGLTPRGDDEYAFSYIYQHGVKGTPPYAGSASSERIKYWRWPYWEKESYYINTRTGLGEASYVKTRLYYDRYMNSLFSYDNAEYDTISRPYAFRSNYDDHTYGGSLEVGTKLLPRNEMKVAFHYKRDVHREHNRPNPYQRFADEIYSVGAEDTITLTDNLKVVAGLSYDATRTLDAQDFISGELVDFPKGESDAWNPQIGLFYELTDTAVLYATVAHKTRLATIKDKYSYRLGTAIPNPDLKPEKAINYQIGYRNRLWDRLSFNAALFYSDIEDFILQATIQDPDDPTATIGQNQNVGKVEQYGLELGIEGNLSDSLEAGINYTLMDRNNRDNDDKLTGTPNHKLFTYVRYRPRTWLSLQADLIYHSNSFSSSDGVRIAGEFAVANVKAVFEPLPGVTFDAGINNLFDTNYAYDEGYPEPGINYFGNVAYRF